MNLWKFLKRCDQTSHRLIHGHHSVSLGVATRHPLRRLGYVEKGCNPLGQEGPSTVLQPNLCPQLLQGVPDVVMMRQTTERFAARATRFTVIKQGVQLDTCGRLLCHLSATSHSV